MKQKPHLRTSKRGRRFKAGRRLFPIVARKAKLSPKSRAMFEQFADPNNYKRETGGYIDFNKKDMQRAWVELGGRKTKTKDTIEIPNEDWEVLWHTHPFHEYDAAIPSNDDIMGSLSDKPDINMIWLPGGRAVIINRVKRKVLKSKTDINKRLNKARAEIFSGRYRNESDFYRSSMRILNRHFADLGLRFEYNDKRGTMKIPVKVREPKNFGALIYPEARQVEKFFETGKSSHKRPKGELYAAELVQAFEGAEAIISKPDKTDDDRLLLSNNLNILNKFKEDKGKLRLALNTIDMMKTRSSHPRYGRLYTDPFPTLDSSLEIKRFIEGESND